MEDASDMDLDNSYDRDVSRQNNNAATPATHGIGKHSSVNGSPMDWTPNLLGDDEEPPATMPTINPFLPSNYIRPADHQDDYMFHHIPHAQRATGALQPARLPTLGSLPPDFLTAAAARGASYERGQLLFGAEQEERLSSPEDIKNRKKAVPSSRFDISDNEVIEANHAETSSTDRTLFKNISSRVPRKRNSEISDDFDEMETQDRIRRVEAEPQTSLFSRIFTNMGVWVNKAKDRSRDIVRQLVGEDDTPEDIVFIPTGSESFSNKRRMISKPRSMPGAWPSESYIITRSQVIAALDTSNIQQPKFIDYNHGKHNPAPALQTSNVPAGFTSSVQYGNRKIKYLFNKSSPLKSKNGKRATLTSKTHNKSTTKATSQTGNHITPSRDNITNTASQTGNHIARPKDSITKTASQTGNRVKNSTTNPAAAALNHQNPFRTSPKRKNDVVADDDHDLLSNKIRKAGTQTKHGIKFHEDISSGHLKTDVTTPKDDCKNDVPGQTFWRPPPRPLPSVVKNRFSPSQTQRKRIFKPTTATSNADNDMSIMTKITQSPTAALSKNSKESIAAAIPVSEKTQNLLNITRPISARDITRVQMSNSISEKAESSSAALFSDKHTLNTYREPEERPSTSSSNTSDDTKETRQENSDRLASTEHAGMTIDSTDVNDHTHVEPTSKQHTPQNHDEQTSGASSELSGPTSEAGTGGLFAHLRRNLKYGSLHVDLRKPKTQQHLDELMKPSAVDEAETQFDELQISDNRKGVREQEELEKQRKAEAEAKRKAEQEKAEAEAQKKAEEAVKKAEEASKRAMEKIKQEKRRRTLDQAVTPAAQNNILEALKGNPHFELRKNLKRSDLRTLVPDTTWLNDEVVNEYLSDLTKKACEKQGYTEQDKKDGKAPPFANIASQFWSSIVSRGVDGVRTWARRPKLDRGRLLSCEGVFIPICHNNHWRLVVISGTERTVEYFDSLSNGSSQPYAAKVLEWVKAVLGSAFDAQQWRIVEGQRSPQQCNGSDCGVFVLQNARAVVLGLDFQPNIYTTTTEGILRARHQIAAQLLSGGVDWE